MDSIMLRAFLDTIMVRRAERLAEWLTPCLPPGGLLLDIGAGTGHNGVAVGRRRAGMIVDLDVANLRVVGAWPARFDGVRMPFADGQFAAAMLLFVLHYVPDPLLLLRETRRVCAGPVLVLQTTYSGRLAEIMLRLYDLAWGPAAFSVARMAGLVAPGRPPLYARMLASRPALLRTFARAGFNARLLQSVPWPCLTVRRDLYRLESAPIGSNLS